VQTVQPTSHEEQLNQDVQNRARSMIQEARETHKRIDEINQDKRKKSGQKSKEISQLPTVTIKQLNTKLVATAKARVRINISGHEHDIQSDFHENIDAEKLRDGNYSQQGYQITTTNRVVGQTKAGQDIFFRGYTWKVESLPLSPSRASMEYTPTNQ